MFFESAATQHGFHILDVEGTLSKRLVTSSASTTGEQRKRKVFFTVVSFLGNGWYRVHVICFSSALLQSSRCSPKVEDKSIAAETNLRQSKASGLADYVFQEV